MVTVTEESVEDPIRREYVGTTGQLPDALAFLKPSCVEFWLDLRELGPTEAGELSERLDTSTATVYRRLNDLESVGLVEEEISINQDGPATAYRAVDMGDLDG